MHTWCVRYSSNFQCLTYHFRRRVKRKCVNQQGRHEMPWEYHSFYQVLLGSIKLLEETSNRWCFLWLLRWQAVYSSSRVMSVFYRQSFIGQKCLNRPLYVLNARRILSQSIFSEWFSTPPVCALLKLKTGKVARLLIVPRSKERGPHQSLVVKRILHDVFTRVVFVHHEIMNGSCQGLQGLYLLQFFL